MEPFLTQKKKQVLLDAHKASKHKRFADRIKTILHLNDGEDYKTIAAWLLLDDSALRDYYRRYESGGLEALLSDNYPGGLSYLEGKELKELEEHLTETVYLHSKDIRHYIKKKYSVTYSVEGVRVLLNRLGFVYKKTKDLPGKGDWRSRTTL